MDTLNIKEEFIGEDKALKKLVEVLESYIEIEFDMLDVCQTIEALKSCSYENQANQNRPGDSKLDFLDEIEKFLDVHQQTRNPIQIMRDNIWEYKSQVGVYGVLMFLENRLALSLEQLLNGAIIKYSKAFNMSQRRTVLSAPKIFKDNNTAFNFHKEIIELRNKHYAHTEYKFGKHILKYIASDDEHQIDLVTDSHTTHEFWAKFDYVEFYKTVEIVRKYLKEEIDGKSKAIKARLSEEQKHRLRSDLTSDCDSTRS